MLSRRVVIEMVVLDVFPSYWVPKEYTKLLGLGYVGWVEEQLEDSGGLRAHFWGCLFLARCLISLK